MLRLDFSLSICSGTTSACTEPKNAKVFCRQTIPGSFLQRSALWTVGKATTGMPKKTLSLFFFFFFWLLFPLHPLFAHLCSFMPLSHSHSSAELQDYPHAVVFKLAGTCKALLHNTTGKEQNFGHFRAKNSELMTDKY